MKWLLAALAVAAAVVPAGRRRAGTTRPSRALVVMLLGTALLAGCLQQPAAKVDAASIGSAIDPETKQPLWIANALPSGDNHDHNDPAQHQNLTTPNWHEVGWDPLVTDRYKSSVDGMGCGGTGVTSKGQKLALVQSISSEVSIIVADITDPAHPQKLGEYLMPNAVIWDATITPDGKHALIGAYPPVPFGNRGLVLPPAPGWGADAPAGASSAPAPGGAGIWKPEIVFRDACTGQEKSAGPEQYVPWGPGIVMVGLQDPKDPKFEDWVPQPVIGPHSVGSQIIDGHVYATSSVTNLQHESSYYSFFEVTDTPAGSILAPLSVLEVPGHPGPTALNGHIDVYLAKHPVTHQLLAYLANWDGMYIYDMSDMRMPKLLSEWHDGNAGSVHTTLPFDGLRDGKHYLLVGQEVGESKDLPSGWVYILDDTNPAKPVEVSRWTLPIKVPWADKNKGGTGLTFSPHYVAVMNDTMLVTNYHGGVWAVDISNIAHPVTLGHFVPDKVSPQPFGGKANGPSNEDVLVDNATGIITTWGNGSGVYELTFDASKPMAHGIEWTDAHPVANK